MITPRRAVGLFRMHEPREVIGHFLGKPIHEDLPKLRLIFDWFKPRHKQRRSMIPELIRKEADLKHIIRFIKTGDSGNIPQFEVPNVGKSESP